MQRQPAVLLAQLLLASVFIVMGAWRIWGKLHGVPTTGGTLTFSAIELALGLAIAAGWKLRATAGLAAALMVADALLSHPFWSLSGPDRGAQLLHFMKNVGLVGGFLLLAATADTARRRR